jgi:hypothetical protein
MRSSWPTNGVKLAARTFRWSDMIHHNPPALLCAVAWPPPHSRLKLLLLAGWPAGLQVVTVLVTRGIASAVNGRRRRCQTSGRRSRRAGDLLSFMGLTLQYGNAPGKARPETSVTRLNIPPV